MTRGLLDWVCCGIGLAGGDCGFAVGLFLFVILVVGGWVVVAVGVSVSMGGGDW